jgi:hypothetical protein
VAYLQEKGEGFPSFTERSKVVSRRDNEHVVYRNSIVILEVKNKGNGEN